MRDDVVGDPKRHPGVVVTHVFPRNVRRRVRSPPRRPCRRRRKRGERKRKRGRKRKRKRGRKRKTRGRVEEEEKEQSQKLYMVSGSLCPLISFLDVSHSVSFVVRGQQPRRGR